MHSNPAEIGERIKAARKAAHLSQTELAQRLDKTMRTVQKYESGEIEPSIAMINAIAKILDISPADLIGYQKPEIQLDSLSDVIAVLYQLNKKAGIRFEIDVQRPPHSEEWSCSLKFKGNDRSAEMNDSLCLILEEFRDEREKLETYWTDQESFDRWIEKELAYYAGAKLQDREVEVLSDLERIQRRIMPPMPTIPWQCRSMNSRKRPPRKTATRSNRGCCIPFIKFNSNAGRKEV